MKKNRRFFRRGLSLLLALALFLPLAGREMVLESSAVTKAEIDALREQAGTLASQKKELQNKLQAVQADKSEALARKELLERQINVIQQEINNIDQQIALYDQLIAEKAAELAQAQADEAAQFDLFCRRMRAMEEQGEISYWSILFSSSDFAELLDNYMMIDEIIQYDNKVINDLVALQEKTAADKAELEQAQAEQEAAKQEQVKKKDELKAQEAEVDKVIDQIKSQEDLLEAMEAELNKAANALDSQIKDKEREYAAQITNVPSESGFLWPLAASYNVLSSLFGPRTHPVTGLPGNHSGIDIPAPAGTNICSAKSGVVITAEAGTGGSWSYGNYVIVSHSDGTSTLYAHMSRIGCKKGDTVKQGQVIGYVGTTGRSTGNHLHFEIRLNGSRVDPVNYFRDKALYVRDNGRLVSIW